jgi:hypothetical protein
MKPRFAGAWHNLSQDGFRSLISGLNKAAVEGYEPIHFTTTAEGFAVILEQRPTQQGEQEMVARNYSKFFQDED